MLSVIIPLAPGETAWRGLLDQLATEAPSECEIILVAAEPGFPTPSSNLNLRMLHSRPGRAVQMNLGAAQARGEWLWFLHADSMLSPQCLPALARFIARGEAALGWFNLAFLADGPRLTRLNALGANLRSRWLGIPFGDQGFVLPASVFARLGGYDEQAAYGEDHLLVWAVQRNGIPLRRIDATIATSARKYGRFGWGATTLRHLLLTARQAWSASRGGVR